MIKLDLTNCKCIITGDFNVNYLILNYTNSLAHKLQEMFNIYNFTQVINCPTRITCNIQTLIDLTSQGWQGLRQGSEHH